MRYGGQAVSEGVMMRGRDRCAVAVRMPSGDIDVAVGALPTWGRPVKAVPVVRGIVALAEAMQIGMAAMAWANGSGGGLRRRLHRVAIVVLLFLAASMVSSRVAIGVADALGAPFAAGLLETAMVIGLCWLYLRLSGRVDRVVRLFGYHGAEHKVVNAFEAGAPLTVASVQPFSTRHPRCGTSFVLVFSFVSTITAAVFGTQPWTFPVVVGVAGELQLLLAARPTSVLVRPGMALQRLTTREPSDAQVEVAIAALRAVVAAERAVAPSTAGTPSAAPAGCAERVAPSGSAAAAR